MQQAILTRIHRRRAILGPIFAMCLIYCVINFLKEKQYTDKFGMIPISRTQPFRWHYTQQYNISNHSDIICRNSIQGQMIIVDDRGYVCPRSHMLENYCCNNETLGSVSRYSCQSCKSSECCAIYEYCVSCCLHPDKKAMLENIMQKAIEENNILYTSVDDNFELCIAKCRTNSQSLLHENTYRDPEAKFCYGENPPNLITENNLYNR